jgi:pimeloyl-ACP methyl ester carboxylesterase
VIAGMIATSPSVATLAARIDMLLDFDRRKHLGRVRARTLVVCADDDQLTPPHLSEELASGIADARRVRLPWGGHAASQTASDAFLDATLSALT